MVGARGFCTKPFSSGGQCPIFSGRNIAGLPAQTPPFSHAVSGCAWRPCSIQEGRAHAPGAHQVHGRIDLRIGARRFVLRFCKRAVRPRSAAVQSRCRLWSRNRDLPAKGPAIFVRKKTGDPAVPCRSGHGERAGERPALGLGVAGEEKGHPHARVPVLVGTPFYVHRRTKRCPLSIGGFIFVNHGSAVPSSPPFHHAAAVPPRPHPGAARSGAGILRRT